MACSRGARYTYTRKAWLAVSRDKISTAKPRGRSKVCQWLTNASIAEASSSTQRNRLAGLSPAITGAHWVTKVTPKSRCMGLNLLVVEGKWADSQQRLVFSNSFFEKKAACAAGKFSGLVISNHLMLRLYHTSIGLSSPFRQIIMKRQNFRGFPINSVGYLLPPAQKLGMIETTTRKKRGCPL